MRLHLLSSLWNRQ